MTNVDTRPEEYYEDFLDQHLRNASAQSSLREEINNVVNDIWTALGSGHSERVYHNAFEVSLRELNIPNESEHTVPINYNHLFILSTMSWVQLALILSCVGLRFSNLKRLKVLMIS